MNIQEHTLKIPEDLVENILTWMEVRTSNRCSNRGGWQADYQNDPPEWIQPFHAQLVEFFKDYTITRAWFNVNGPGHSNRRHRHHVGETSAVLYLQVPENSGRIVFQQGRVFNRIQPTVGKLLVFPSNLMHEVEENKSQENRISMAFNLVQN
jgi:hypothetical protein